MCLNSVKIKTCRQNKVLYAFINNLAWSQNFISGGQPVGSDPIPGSVPKNTVTIWHRAKNSVTTWQGAMHSVINWHRAIVGIGPIAPSP
ncbi:hypothetical protein [Cynomolgus macaque cytomegalovirus strain Mauritius]|uniref:Uncharacterized protein n=1 Tax=Cynomolgus macaque cytomegalovirus strain Mauritius TaxID=1690255 RepID=A0A0K1H082_9BETA|nr:hypothetical protein [Cynomolgus macaque cytomegalovirus strain Mauritius]AXG21872.1 hypothetical protein [synthetic construct]AXG22140.1 hypothetical protein [synthetic construct]